jgi:hypothetical protein
VASGAAATDGTSAGDAPTSDAKETGVPPADVGPGTGVGVHPVVCDHARFRSAVVSAGPADAVPLSAYATALQLSGYEPVLHTDGGPTPPDSKLGQRKYAAGRDSFGDVVLLFETGELVVASRCALDKLGQVRRLDQGLAAAVQVWAQVTKQDWQAAMARWVVPASYHADAPVGYSRRYLPETVDLQKALAGTLSLSHTPVQAVFALYGQTDAPSTQGDVITLDSLMVAGKLVASAQKHTVQGPVVLAWSLLPALQAGEQEWSLKLLIADAGLEWKTGQYRAFVEVLQPDPKAAFSLTVQGALPGLARTAREMDELKLPGDVTNTVARAAPP